MRRRSGIIKIWLSALGVLAGTLFPPTRFADEGKSPQVSVAISICNNLSAGDLLSPMANRSVAG
jgi:hypothetical protein